MAEPARIVMMGTGTFALPTFERLLADSPFQIVGLVTQPDRDAGHIRGSTRQIGPSLKDIALERSVTVFQPTSVNTPEGIAKLREWRPDLLVVAAYGQILKADVLAAARHGGINVHASLLPKYRGAAPVAWAILRGETTTGVTIIHMTTGLDAGGMLVQEAVEILPDETAGELEARLAPVGAQLAVRVAEEVVAGNAHAVLQDLGQVTKAPKLKKEDGLIDWSQSAEQVGRHVLAMQPWPTAFTWLHCKGRQPERVIITRVGGRDTGRPALELPSPGTVLTTRFDESIWVVAGDNTIVEIAELQPAGKKRMIAAEFLRGRAIQLGDRFGSEGGTR